MTATNTIDNAIAGGLIGLATGDALGATVEFLSPAEIARHHGQHREIIGGGAFNWRPGQGTDDTDLTLAVADGYLNVEGRPGPAIHAIAAEMLGWYHTNPPDIGATTRAALARLDDTGDPSTSGQREDESCGNGSLMRALPTALVRTDPELRRREAAQISAITHAHPKCIDSCIVYTEIAAALLEGASPRQAIAVARNLDLDPNVRTVLATPAEVPVEELRTSGYVLDSLTCAIWAIQQPADYEAVLVALVNRGDDADTTGAIAGGLLGLTTDAIPDRWTRMLEAADRIEHLAAALGRIRR